jgi:hypothetical protein
MNCYLIRILSGYSHSIDGIRVVEAHEPARVHSGSRTSSEPSRDKFDFRAHWSSEQSRSDSRVVPI